MSIAFFDLDKTLLAENSGSLWVRSELRQGYLGRRMAARSSSSTGPAGWRPWSSTAQRATGWCC